MTRYDVADLLEGYSSKVTKLPGISRINPHAFAEAKSDLAGEMMRQALDLRSGGDGARPLVSKIQTGSRIIGRRVVRVERR